MPAPSLSPTSWSCCSPSPTFPPVVVQSPSSPIEPGEAMDCQLHSPAFLNPDTPPQAPLSTLCRLPANPSEVLTDNEDVSCKLKCGSLPGVFWSFRVGFGNGKTFPTQPNGRLGCGRWRGGCRGQLVLEPSTSLRGTEYRLSSFRSIPRR